MRKQKLFSCLLTAAMLIGVLPAAAETGDAVTTVYKATDAWSTEVSGNEEWSWEYSDKTTSYEFKSLTVAVENQTVFGTDPSAEPTAENRIGGFGWKRGSAWNDAGVGQYWMFPYIKTTGTTSDERAKFAVSRTFTAPMSGKVSLSTENGKIYGGAKQSGNGNTTAFVRITVNGRQIWPESGEIQIPYTGAYIQTMDFDEITAVVYRGDKLRFEVYNGDGDAGNGKLVYWSPVVTYNTTSADENMVYNSDDVWPEVLNGTTNITNDDPVWQFLYRNTLSNNEYKAYTLSVGNKTQNYLPPVQNSDGSYTYANQTRLTDEPDTRTRIFSDSDNNGYMRNALGRYWMRLSVATQSEPKQNANNRIVKSFTAPRSGNVCISATDMSGDAKIYNQKLSSTNPYGAVVNILKWAPDGTNTTIWTHTFAYNANTTPVDGVEVLDFENMCIYMNKGEQLWFMVSGATGGSAYAKQVFWIPVVSYYDTDEVSADRIYKATDAWSMDSGNKYNGHNEWKWEQYDATGASSQFVELTSFRKDKARFGQVPTDASTDNLTGPSWEQSASNSNLAGVGQYWMTPRADQNSSADIKKNHAVSRSFTAPLTGTVTLSAEDVTPDGIVHAYGGSPDPSQNAPSYLRITKNGKQIWPKYGAEYKISATTTFAQDAPISPVALTINQGDVIRFEAYNGSGDVGWGKRVWWRPQVEYTYIEPASLTAEKPVFKNEQGDELTTYEDAAAAGIVNVSLNVNAVNYNKPEGIMCIAQYDSDGYLHGIEFSPQTSILSGENAFEITGMKLENVSDGYIKVFLFESINTLCPLSDIGNSPVLSASGFAGFSTNTLFSGEAAGSDAVALCILKDENAGVVSENILFIDQCKTGSEGAFEIPVPNQARIGAIKSSANGRLHTPDIPLYCSASGSADGDGSAERPFASLQTALELVDDGGKIIINGELTLSSDFKWPASDKKITISGINGAVLDIKEIAVLDIYSDTIFENLIFGSEAEGTGRNMAAKNVISANGYHVVIKDTVSTQTVMKLRGGSLSADVDSVNLEVYGGNYQSIYGGGSTCNVKGDCRLIVGGNVNYSFSIDDASDSYYPTVIHGGSWGGIVGGDCITTLKDNARAAYVYGGTHGQKTSHVEGKIKVNIESGSFMNVFAAAYVTEGKSITSEINMTGGTVEGLFASDNPVSGDITIKVLGGEVKRRIYSGCYNDYGFSGFKSNNYVNGSTTIILGPDARLITGNLANRGIFAGSRLEEKPAGEVNKVIFTGGSYDSFKHLLGEQGLIPVNDSYHDYLVSVQGDGDVSSFGPSAISVSAEEGTEAYINGAVFSGDVYNLTSPETLIEFKKPSSVTSLQYKSAAEESEITVEFVSELTELLVAAAVYDTSDRLICSSIASPSDGDRIVKLTVPCNLDDGESYTIKAMLWSSTDKMIPQCSPKKLEIN